jgi:hypothetical protein
LALQQGRKEEAVERFRAAWDLYKDPGILCDLGTIEHEMGRARDAALNLSKCLRLLKPEDRQVIGKKAERLLKDVRARVGVITVEANVPDAEVAVDGTIAGTLPLADPIFVDPGSHGVEVRAPGYEADSRLALMHAGSSLLLRMRLEPMRAEIAPPPQGRVPLEPQTEAKPQVPAPSPMLAAKAPALLPASGGITEPTREPARAAVILTGLGLGVAGAAVGSASFMAADVAGAEANAMYRAQADSLTKCNSKTPDPCMAAEGRVDKARVLTAFGVAGVAVSAVGGALVVYELVRSAPQGRAANARVTIAVAPGEGALKVTGSF